MQQILKKYVMDIIRKRQWKKQADASTVKMLNVFRDVRYQSIFPDLFAEVKEGNIEEAYQGDRCSLLHFRQSVDVYVLRNHSAKENVSVASKVNAVSIGKLERFVADYALEHDIKPRKLTRRTDTKLPLSVPVLSGLTCAGDLAKTWL